MRPLFLRLIAFIFILLLCAGTALLFLPSLISTNWGREQLLEWVNYWIPGRLDVQELELHWGGGQKIRGIALNDSEGRLILEIEQFSTQAALWQLLRHPLFTHSTQVRRLNAFIERSARGEVNLQEALGIHHRFPPFSPLSLSEVDADLDFPNPQGSVRVHLKGSTRQNDLKGSFDLDVLLPRKIQFVEIRANVLNFPVDLIDLVFATQFPRFKSCLSSTLGPFLNVKLEERDPKESLFRLALSSEKMAATSLLVAHPPLGNAPLDLYSNKSPELSLEPKTDSSASLGIQTSGRINKGSQFFEFDFRAALDQPHEWASFFSSLPQGVQGASLKVTHFPLAFAPPWMGSHLDAEVGLNPVKGQQWEARVYLKTSDWVLPEALFQIGKTVNLKSPAKVLLDLRSDSPLELFINAFHLQLADLSPPTHRVELSLPSFKFSRLFPGSSLDLKQVLLTVEGQGLKQFNSSASGEAALRDSRAAYLREPIRFSHASKCNLDSFAWDIRGILSIDRMVIEDGFGDLPTLEKIVIPWSVDSKEQRFSATLKGFARSEAHPNPSQISARFEAWSIFTPVVKAAAGLNFSAMPVSFASFLLQRGNLAPLLGPVIDLDFNALYDPSKKESGYWDLRLDSAQLHLKGRFKSDRSTATLFDPAKPAAMRLTLTPASYPHWKQFLGIKNGRELASDFSLSGNLTKCRIPLKPEWWDRAAVEADFFTTDLYWKDLNPLPLALVGHLNSQNLSDTLQFSLASTLPSPSSLAIRGEWIHPPSFFQKEQRQHVRGLRVEVEGRGLSPLLMQNLGFLRAKQTQKLEAAFGDAFDIRAHGDLMGLSTLVEGYLIGNTGEVRWEGQLQEGVLTLQSPLEGSMTLTPLLIQTFLPHAPLLGEAVSSEDRLHYKISPQDFSCPLAPFKLDQLQIGEGVLESNKILLRNEGEVRDLLPLASKPTVLIWFTPLVFQLNRSLLNFKRWDMLVADAYPVACWGDFDLSRDRGNFVLGVEGRVVRELFGVKNAKEQELLQIPFQISKGKIAMEKKNTLKQLGAWAAQRQGRSKGKLLGQLLNLTLPGQEPPPPPTTQSFPWE